MDYFSLKGKVALVTGAAGLLGKQHCTALAEAGASVVVADLNLGLCKALADALPGEGHLPITLDVAMPHSLRACRAAVLEKYGHLDVLVNNAAVDDKFESPALAAQQSRFENYPLDLWLRSLEVNVTGVFLASQILGSIMAEQAGGGSIINIASTYGIVGPDQHLYQKPDGEQVFFKSPSYPAAKGAVLNFTRYLAAYWGSSGLWACAMRKVWRYRPIAFIAPNTVR